MSRYGGDSLRQTYPLSWPGKRRLVLTPHITCDTSYLPSLRGAAKAMTTLILTTFKSVNSGALFPKVLTVIS